MAGRIPQPRSGGGSFPEAPPIVDNANVIAIALQLGYAGIKNRSGTFKRQFLRSLPTDIAQQANRELGEIRGGDRFRAAQEQAKVLARAAQRFVDRQSQPLETTPRPELEAIGPVSSGSDVARRIIEREFAKGKTKGPTRSRRLAKPAKPRTGTGVLIGLDPTGMGAIVAGELEARAEAAGEAALRKTPAELAADVRVKARLEADAAAKARAELEVKEATRRARVQEERRYQEGQRAKRLAEQDARTAAREAAAQARKLAAIRAKPLKLPKPVTISNTRSKLLFLAAGSLVPLLIGRKDQRGRISNVVNVPDFADNLGPLTSNFLTFNPQRAAPGRPGAAVATQTGTSSTCYTVCRKPRNKRRRKGQARRRLCISASKARRLGLR